MSARKSGCLIAKLITLLVFQLGWFGISWAAPADVLYIGGEKLESFDAVTGNFLGELGQTPPGACNHPIDQSDPYQSFLCPSFGMFVRGGQLSVVNGNTGRPIDLPGDVLQFTRNNGNRLNNLLLAVNANGTINQDAPFQPRGMIFWRGKVYVAEFFGSVNDTSIPGSIKVYNPGNGKLLQKLAPDQNFIDNNNLANAFHPRGVVIGPDGLLYATLTPLPPGNYPLGGFVIRVDPKTSKFIDVFISSIGGCVNPVTDLCNPVDQMNRPEGLVFGPDGRLYVTSFRKDATDVDKILVFQGPSGQHPGMYVNKINLAPPGFRAFAQALLFGPNNYLFVPITGPNGIPSQGEVRRYDVSNIYSPSQVVPSLVPPTGTEQQRWYLTFGGTDPGTLAYKKP